MAEIIGGGEPVNEFERAVIKHLRDEAPDDWFFWHNIDVPLQNGRKSDIDILLVTGHTIFLIDVKGTRGRIDVAGRKWYPVHRQSFFSPVEKLRNHVRAFKGHLQSRGMDGGVYVTQAVILPAAGAYLVDPATGNDTDAMHVITGMADIVPELSRPPRGTGRFHRDIGRFRQQIMAAVDGAVTRRTGPKQFGNWEVIESLGESSERAEVTEYRAQNVHTAGPAVSSVLLRVYQTDPFEEESVRRAEHRAISNSYEMLERLGYHPCIVPCRDFFPNEDQSQYILVLEDVPAGALLLRLTDPQLALTADGKMRVIRDMLRGLAYAHAHEVVHRALSPATVLVTGTGDAMLTGFDYGRPAAPRSPSQSVVHRLPDVLDEVYVAPECQSAPQALNEASDVYSAGVIAYQTLTGELPFVSSVDQHQRESVLPEAPMAAAGLPGPVAGLLRRMCARNPGDRPTAAQALEALATAPDPVPEEGQVDYRNLPEGHQLTRKYTVQRRIGKGSFSAVYQVYDNLADGYRALKIVDRDHVSLIGRTQQEYHVLLRLQNLEDHEHLVRVENADYLPNDVPYLVFEYLDGKDVKELARDRVLGPADAIRLGRQAASGLAFLHSNGIYHCDIKPSNLLWTADGCKIIDFNVAVTAESSLSRVGGTSKYIPPDTRRATDLVPADLADRDVYGLGVSVYQVLTGEYPFPGGGPSLSEKATDPRTIPGLTDLSNELAATVLKAIEPLRGDRYGSASEFQAALDAIGQEIYRKAVPVPADEPLPPPVPAAADANPFVAHLQSLYSQSPASNAGTRGSDKNFSTYVATALDQNLVPDVLDGTYRLVIITGNAGDGKTAFLEHLVAEALRRGGTPGQPRANGTDIALPGGRVLRTNNDGSQDEGDRANDDVLQDFFAPYADGADETSGTRSEDIRLIAINEGRLVDFLTLNEERFGTLSQTVTKGLAGQVPDGDVMVVNLNQRSLVAKPDEDSAAPPIFDRVLGQLTQERYWAACDSCTLAQTCYAPHNARTFAHPSAGPKITARLRNLYRLVHLRGQLHITLRDLRSALAFMLTSGRDCAQIHELYDNGDKQDILSSFYFNSWLGTPGTADRLLRLLRELDVSSVPVPALDGKLAAIGPTGDQSVMTIDQRGGYDLDLLRDAFGGVQQRDPSRKESREAAALYLASARRRFYFEGIDDDQARAGLPFKSAERFMAAIASPKRLREWLPDLVRAINRGEGLPDVAAADGGLALATRDVPGGTIRSYRVFPQSALALSIADSPGGRYVEGEPDALELSADGGNGQLSTLRIRLDLFELLDRQEHGYLPGAAELQGRYLDLLIFKNELSATPYQEVILTTDGRDAHRIRREPGGRLVMTALAEGDNDGAQP